MATLGAYNPVLPSMGSTTSESLTKKKPPELPNFFGRTPEAQDVLRPISLPKIPGADPFIESQFGSVNALGSALAGDTARFRAAIEASQPQVGAFTQQELADIGNIYSPTGYEAQLANIRAQRSRALANLTNVLFGDLRRQSGLDIATQGGVAGAGLGSYFLNRAATQAGKLRAQEAYDAAQSARQDIADLLNARVASQGKRQLLTDAVMARLFQPADKEIAAQTAYSQALQAALNNALANSFLGQATPVT